MGTLPLKGLSKTWQEFANAWLAFLETPNEENESRLIKSFENYPVGEKESQQDDWVWETKQIIQKIKNNNDRDSWRMIYNFMMERYNKEHPEVCEKILEIAETKGVGEYVWKI